MQKKKRSKRSKQQEVRQVALASTLKMAREFDIDTDQLLQGEIVFDKNIPIRKQIPDCLVNHKTFDVPRGLSFPFPWNSTIASICLDTLSTLLEPSDIFLTPIKIGEGCKHKFKKHVKKNLKWIDGMLTKMNCCEFQR